MFSNTSAKGNDFDLIPAKTLAHAHITVRGIKNSQQTQGEYVDIELTIQDGPFAGRKIFEMIGSPLDARNSDGFKQMGLSALTRILEACGKFIPTDPNSYQQFNRPDITIQQLAMAIDGTVGAISVRVEKGKDGHADKNKVDWLTPNPAASSGYKLWEKLKKEGPTAAPAGTATPAPGGMFAVAAAAQAAPASSFPAAPAAAPAAAQTPPWLKPQAAAPSPNPF